MLRTAASLLLLAACGFRATAPTAAQDARGDAPPPPVDAPVADAAPPIDAAPAPAHCLDALWCRRRAITISALRVSGGPHAHFPVLVQLAGDADLQAAQVLGYDLRFTAADGVTPLPYERESFDHVAGDLVAWVDVPALSPTADTLVYLYYGNAVNAVDQAQPQAAWDGSFVAVYHLDELGGARADVTSSAEPAIPQGNVGSRAGQIGGAAALDGTGYLRATESTELDATGAAGTVEAWVSFVTPTAGALQYLLTSSNSFTVPKGGYAYGVQGDGDYYFYPSMGAEDYDLATHPFGGGNAWHHAAVTWDLAATPKVALYVDGAAVPITDKNDAAWTTATNPGDWLWGGTSDPTQPSTFLHGALDEIHVSTSARSAGWIQTAYRNQSDAPGVFYRVGPPESLPL